MPEMINIGGLEADLVLNTSKLDKNLANAERALHVIKLEIIDLQNKFAKGEISANDFAQATGYLRRSQQELRDAMTTATNAVNMQATALKGAASSAAQMNEAMHRSRMAGMALMQIGYIIDDIQYGFRSIVNNVAPFVYSISAAMGASTSAAMAWGAGIQIAAVAAYQLYNNWDQVMDLMGMGKVRTEAEEMEELGKKTAKTADEQARLNKYKREQLQIKSLMDSQTSGEKQHQQRVKTLLEEAGGDAVVGKLAQAIQAGGQGEKMSPGEKKSLDKILAPSYILAPNDPRQAGIKAAHQAKLDQINARINQEDIKRAQKLLVDAQNDPTGAHAKSVMAKLGRVPGNEELIAGFRENLPENLSKRTNQQLEADLNAESRENFNKYQKKLDDDKAKAADEEKDFDSNAESVFKSAIGDAKKMLPGADDAAKGIALQSAVAGDPRMIAAAKKQIQDMLEAKGINAGVAGAAAEGIMSDAQGKVKEDVIKEMMSPEQERTNKTQQFNAAELAARVQAGVGGDETKKQTSLQQQMVKHLADIATKEGVAPLQLAGGQ